MGKQRCGKDDAAATGSNAFVCITGNNTYLVIRRDVNDLFRPFRLPRKALAVMESFKYY